MIKGNDDLSHVYILKRFDQAVLIDPSHSINEIKQAITGLKVSFILLTHGHIDHTALINEFKCPIYMHKDDYELLFNDDQNGAKDLKIKRQFQAKDLDIRFVKDLDTIAFLDAQIVVYHTPGHTKGSLCFLYQKNLYTGDLLFKNGIGRTDLVGGSTASIHRSIKRLFQVLSQTTKFYPGHDEPSSLKEEKSNAYIQKLLSK